MRSLIRLQISLIGIALPLLCGRVSADRYIAFSLTAARIRIEHAGKEWRTTEPQVLNLAGINQVEGFVYDTKKGDLILVGHHEEGRETLTLDDLVVAIRARLRYNEWPLVSIDPEPDSEQTGHQHVRFEGHVENTAFGQTMFVADYRMKKIGMGIEESGVVGFHSYWDGYVAQQNKIADGHASRFWFFPTMPEVIERDGVCVVRGLKVKVFARLMKKTANGDFVDDLEAAKYPPAEMFANDMSVHFEEMCKSKSRPDFNRLRGLEELVGLTQALEGLHPKPDLDWWLNTYAVATVETPQQAKLLRRNGENLGQRFYVSGGVQLTALAIKLRKGNVIALRDAVLTVRPVDEPLSWSFLSEDWVIPLEPGSVPAEDVGPLYAQAQFLHQQGRFADEVDVLKLVLQAAPDLAEAWYNQGVTLGKLRKFAEAVKCYDKAVEIQPDYFEAWYNKGIIFGDHGLWEEAVRYYDHALVANTLFAEAWCNKGGALENSGLYEEALKCCDRALELKPVLVEAWLNKSLTLDKLGRFEEALACSDRAVTLKPDNAKAWLSKGLCLYHLKSYGKARAALNQAAHLGSEDAKHDLSVLHQEGH